MYLRKKNFHFGEEALYIYSLYEHLTLYFFYYVYNYKMDYRRENMDEKEGMLSVWHHFASTK